jgi:hypothetical protein
MVSHPRRLHFKNEQPFTEIGEGLFVLFHYMSCAFGRDETQKFN